MQKSKFNLRANLNKKNLVRVLVVVIFFSLVFWILNLLGQYFKTENAGIWINSFGYWGIFAFSFLYFVSFIIPAMTGLPLVILSIGAFGLDQTVAISFLVMILGGAANFLIARTAGRGILIKLLGVKNLKKINKAAEKFDIKLLIISRLFEGFLYEWVSYAAGLTRIRFSVYILITFFFSIPYVILLYLLASTVEDLGQLYIIFTGINYVSMGIPFAYFLVKRVLKKII